MPHCKYIACKIYIVYKYSKVKVNFYLSYLTCNMSCELVAYQVCLIIKKSDLPFGRSEKMLSEYPEKISNEDFSCLDKDAEIFLL